MQQSCFLYNEKGPYYIQEDETLAEKQIYKADLALRNAERYEKDKEEQEIAYPIHQLYGIHAQSRLRAEFKHIEKIGAYVFKKGNGRVNWYQY